MILRTPCSVAIDNNVNGILKPITLRLRLGEFSA
jgi:hypothetical protein